MSTNQISFSSSSSLRDLQTEGTRSEVQIQNVQPQQGLQYARPHNEWTQLESSQTGQILYSLPQTGLIQTGSQIGPVQIVSPQYGSTQLNGSRRNSITKLSMNASTMSPRVMSPTPDLYPVQRRASLTIKSGSRPQSVDLGSPQTSSPSHQTALGCEHGKFQTNHQPFNPGFSDGGLYSAMAYNKNNIQEFTNQFSSISSLPNAPQLHGKLPGKTIELPRQDFYVEETDIQARIRNENLKAIDANQTREKDTRESGNWEELIAPLLSDPILVMFTALGLLVLSVFCILTRDSVPFSYVALLISAACVAFCLKKGI